MNPEWLCYVDGQEYGPYTWPQLVQMAQAGNVVPQTHVRRNFDSQWYLAEQVPGLFSASAAATNPKTAAHPAAPAKLASGTKKAGSKSGTQPAMKAVAKAAPVAAPMLPEPAAAPAAAQAPAVAPAVASVPKGRVISKSPAAAAAANKPIPLQQQPAAEPSAAFVVPKVATATAPATDSNGVELPTRKKDNSKQLVLYLGGAIVGVALVGGAALIYNFTRPPEQPKETAAAPVEIPTTEKDPNVIGEEVNPADEVNPAEAAKPAPAKNAAKSGTKTEPAKAKTPEVVPGASPATTTLVRTVAAWKPIEKFGSVGMKNGLTCTKMIAYLAADASGRKVAVRSTGSAPPAAAPADNAATASVAPNTDANGAATPAIIAPTPAPAGPVKYSAAEAASFLFIELTITNKDTTKPQNYAGWNNGETAAVLVDAAGKEFKLAPASATPGASRQKAKEVKPGETFQDTLVFEVPPTADLQFRVVLPPIAFSPKLKGAWGYEIGGGYLASAETPVANAPAMVGADGKPLPPGAHSSGRLPIPGLDQPPPPMPQPAAVQAPAQPAGEPEMKKDDKPGPPTSRIPIPGLEDDSKPAAPATPKKPDEVPNLAPPPVKK